MPVADPHAAIIRKLRTRTRLTEEDCGAIRGLTVMQRTHQPTAYIVREGDTPGQFCPMVLSGVAYRHKVTANGSRQIVSIHVAGDFLDLQHLFLSRADHNVQALNALQVANIDREQFRALALARPNIANALWIDALIDASVFREWVVNVGRRDARTRVAHLLCEMSVRMEAAGLSVAAELDMPMTQEQLGDAVGLTSVHVNRTLKLLTDDGLIARNRRSIAVLDWARLSAVGDFNSLYLHLDQSDEGLENRQFGANGANTAKYF